MIELKSKEDISDELNGLSKVAVDSAFRVHKKLGVGLLEKVYELALMEELADKGINVERQASLPVFYNGKCLDEAGYRLDLLIEEKLIIEVKAIETILPVHQAQLLTYLKLSKLRLGLLINFNAELLKHGIKRIVL